MKKKRKLTVTNRIEGPWKNTTVVRTTTKTKKNKVKIKVKKAKSEMNSKTQKGINTGSVTKTKIKKKKTKIKKRNLTPRQAGNFVTRMVRRKSRGKS